MPKAKKEEKEVLITDFTEAISTPIPEFKEETVSGEIQFTTRDPETGELVIGFFKENTK